jgi:hypothetical protein
MRLVLLELEDRDTAGRGVSSHFSSTATLCQGLTQTLCWTQGFHSRSSPLLIQPF